MESATHFEHAFRNLSQENIQLTRITFETLKILKDSSRQMIHNPFLVIFFHKNIHRFSIKDFQSFKPVWLLIFSTEYNHQNPFCPFQTTNQTNYFDLRFNSEVMVVCPGDSKIYDWYSLDGIAMRWSGKKNFKHNLFCFIFI